MKSIIKYLFSMTLVFAGVFLFAITASAATPEFRADDEQQKIILTTSMPAYDGNAGYAIHALGYLLNITSGSTSKTVFLEGGMDYHQFRYATIIAEFNTEHGASGKTLAENYFYNGSGTMTLDTVFTLWQKGGGYSSSYDDYKCVKAGKTGWVQAKINDSSNVETPSKEVYASNWTSQIKTFPVKFWNWSEKSYCWSYYATRMNNCKTTTYPLNPSTFTDDTVRYYTAPYYASDWQNAAMLCEFSTSGTPAIREYYKRTIVRQNSMNFKVTEIQAPSSITDSGTVTVLYSNEHFNRGVQTVSTNLTLSGGSSIDYELDLDTNNYSGCYLTYTIYGYSEGSQTLTATVNGGTNGYHRYSELTYTDNIKTKGITVSAKKDFGVWGLSVPTGDIYENDTIALTVNWTNYKSGSYSNVPATIYIGGNLVYTDYLSFNGYGTITKTYYLNVGSGVGSKQITARINWSQYLNESDPNDNERSYTINVLEYYEFSISGLSVSPTSVYQNENITVSFRTDSWNMTKAYYNIPVEVLYDGVPVRTEYVYFAPYGINYHSYTLNVGSEVGTHSVSARINWPNRYNEADPNNNQIASQLITVRASTNLGIEYISTNGEYREGTEVITTFRVRNVGSNAILPNNNLKASLNIIYSGGNISMPMKTQIVIPANGDNLIYFKWLVPSGTAGKTMYMSAVINPDNSVSEMNTGDNTVTAVKTVIAANNSSTPDTRFERTAPSDFIRVNPPSNAGVTGASWSEWVYENNSFIRRTYGLSLNSGNLTIVPDANAPSRVYKNGLWHMGSGYGFTVNWALSTSTLYGTTAPVSSSYTGAQTASIFLPEYKYSTAVGKYRSLNLTGANTFQLPQNPYAQGNARLHFVSLWFPDGVYTVRGYVSDIWTPAGMLTGYVNSNTINITQSAYDDWYIGR